jgi:hypothetical protein
VIRVFALQYIRFSPCGEMIASWGHDGMIRLNRAQDAIFLGSTQWRSRLGLVCLESIAFPTRRRQVLARTFNNQTVHFCHWSTQKRMELRDSDPTIHIGEQRAKSRLSKKSTQTCGSHRDKCQVLFRVGSSEQSRFSGPHCGGRWHPHRESRKPKAHLSSHTNGALDWPSHPTCCKVRVVPA